MRGWLLLVLACPAFAGGRVAGTVAYAGKKPTPTRINRTDLRCTVELTDSPVLLSPGGKALANVVVRVSQNAPVGAPLPAASVTFTQRDCRYLPRVQGAMKGQTLVVSNADGTLHNVHGWLGADERQTLFNVAQPPGARQIEKQVQVAEVVKLECDIHPWMKAFVVVSAHPYFAVSDADGHFELPELPAGHYTLEAWHETLGTRTAEVTVSEGQAVDPKFAYF